MAIDRRMFLQVTTAVLAASGDAVRTAFANVDPVTPPTPILKLESDPHRASIPFLSWDTEGVNRVQRNLLRTGPGITLRLKSGGFWRGAVDLPARQHKLSGNGTQYHLSVSPQEELIWNIKPGHGGLTLSFRSEEHTSELQSRQSLVCRLLLAKTAQQALTLQSHVTLTTWTAKTAHAALD